MLLVFGEQNRTMISNSDIEFGKISTSPSTLLFPLPCTLISNPKNTQKRNQEILIERIPNKPNILISHHTQKPKRVDPRQIAATRNPFPWIDQAQIFPLVSDAIPCVSMEGTCVVVEWVVIWIENPVTFEEVTVGDCKWLWGWRRVCVERNEWREEIDGCKC